MKAPLGQHIGAAEVPHGASGAIARVIDVAITRSAHKAPPSLRGRALLLQRTANENPAQGMGSGAD